MAKVGLKDTLALLAKGYSKKEIDALAAVDEEQEIQETVKHEIQEKEEIPAPDPQPDPQVEELKKQLEETMEKLKAAEEKTKKIQKDNINSNSAPASEEMKMKQQEDLTNLVRSFM